MTPTDPSAVTTPPAKTKLSKMELDYVRMYYALKRITRYQSTNYMQRHSERDWACGYHECLGMAYDNVQSEAKSGLKGVRKPNV